MINRLWVGVESCDRRDSHAWLKLGRARLAAQMWPGIRIGQKLAVRIRPEDVVLCAGHPGRISARNILPGHVQSIRSSVGGAYVTVDVGFPLISLVTRAAIQELRIHRGSPIFALVKATVIHPETEVRLRVRVSLEGDRGAIDPERLDFLRELDQSGSISAAGRELGISYRTAWMWVQAINRAWGRPLVRQIHGGHGGGGTSLTPEGQAAVRFATELEKRSNQDLPRPLKR
jgi:molybdate transport system regulatory protein